MAALKGVVLPTRVYMVLTITLIKGHLLVGVLEASLGRYGFWENVRNAKGTPWIISGKLWRFIIQQYPISSKNDYIFS